MGTTSLTIDNELLSATSIKAADSARDLKYVDTPFLNELGRVHGEGKPFKTSGHKWVGAFNTGDHSTPTARRTGYEQLNLGFSSVLTPMTLVPAEIVYPVGISETEIDMAGGELAVLDLASERSAAVMSKAKRDFEKHMLVGNVSGWDDFHSLNGDEEGDGFLEALAPGTQQNIIGGFNKLTYGALPGAQNQFFDVSSSFNTSGLVGINRSFIKARARAKEGLNSMTAICSEKAMENYKRSIQSQERYMVASGNEALDAGNLHLMMSGVKAQVSTYLGDYTVTGSKRLSIALIDLKSLYFMWGRVTRNGYFSMSEFKNIGNGYDVRVAQVLVRGQLWVKGWAGCAYIADAETF